MIPPDKTLLVTGDPRSRTSLMMGMLGLLGVPLAGMQFPQRETLRHLRERGASAAELSRAEHRAKQAERLNPPGFWELPGVVTRGIATRHEKEQCLGRAVKCVSSGAFPRTLPDGRIVGTDSELVHAYLVCLRHPQSVAASQTHLLGDVEVAEQTGWASARRPMDPLRYLSGTGRFALWAAEHPEVQDRMLLVDHGEWDQNLPGTLRKVGQRLGVEVERTHVREARWLFDPALTQVRTLPEWPAAQAAAGALASEVYEALRAQDWSALRALASSVEAHLAEAAKARNGWVDIDPDSGDERRFFGTWTLAHAEHYKLLAGNIGCCRDALQVSLKRKRAERPSLCPKDCPFYARSSHQQEIPVPLELTAFDLTDAGRVVRLPLVDCGRDGDLKTHTECLRCWQQGWMRGAEVLGPQRFRGGEV